VKQEQRRVKLVYKQVCSHSDCDKLITDIRKCNSCGIVIITDRGVVNKNEV